MKTFAPLVVALLLSMQIFAQASYIAYQSNGSFEENNPTSIIGASILDGEVPYWSTDWNTSYVQSEILTSGIPIFASDSSYFAKVYYNHYLRNELQDKMFPGQLFNIQFDHTGFVEGNSSVSVYLHRPGFGNINGLYNVLLENFISPGGFWQEKAINPFVPVHENYPCYFDHLDLRSYDAGSTSGAQGGYTLFDRLYITGCQRVTEDLVFASVGSAGNCAQVNFSVDLNLESKKWFYWEFGDGETLCGPMEPNPSHAYPDQGTYNVRLTTVTEEGCIEIVEKVVTIECEGCEELEAGFTYDCVDCIPNYVWNYDKETGQWTTTLAGYSCEVDFTDISQAGSMSEINSWTWTFDGEEFSSQQHPTKTFGVEPLANLPYEVCLSIIDSDGCVDQICQPVGLPCFFFDDAPDQFRLQSDEAISEVANKNELIVFPNPANDHLNIKWPGSFLAGDFNLQIIDIRGKLIRQINASSLKSSTLESIDVSDLAVGTYLLRLANETEVVTKKVIIQR